MYDLETKVACPTGEAAAAGPGSAASIRASLLSRGCVRSNGVKDVLGEAEAAHPAAFGARIIQIHGLIATDQVLLDGVGETCHPRTIPRNTGTTRHARRRSKVLLIKGFERLSEGRAPPPAQRLRPAPQPPTLCPARASRCAPWTPWPHLVATIAPCGTWRPSSRGQERRAFATAVSAGAGRGRFRRPLRSCRDGPAMSIRTGVARGGCRGCWCGGDRGR
jgi:hypothetical protein